MRDSDWAALADIQFILYNRIANQLNEALTGIALSDMPEASGKPPGYWKDRAIDKITNVLNMFTAWTWLIRYKLGEPIPQRAIRPFETNALLAWLGRQLQLNPPPKTNMNPLLHGNQESLQEALLLLYSVAYTQGSGVRLAFEATKLGTWFRIRFDRHQAIPSDIDALITSFGDHWRDQDTVFELTTARDFIRLNGCALTLNLTETGAEFAFFVRGARTHMPLMPLKPAEPVKQALTHTTPTAQKDAYPTVRKPGQTRPLDPDAVARYLDHRGTASPEATPVIKESELDALVKEQQPTPPRQRKPDTEPPTLAMLRPYSPAMREQINRKAQTEHAKTAAQDARDSSNGTMPLEPEKTDTGTIILRAPIPEPQLPERFRKPPAATSNVALTRDTQTFMPVKPDTVTATGSYESRDRTAHQDRQEAPDHRAAKEDNHG
ncbi:MAG: hypothetical protein JXA10_02470 [Anaerolineae bacterium]|nr:hypothetical protein [Anaerolineae bacterium]